MYARALVKAYQREAPWAFSALAALNDDHFYSFFNFGSGIESVWISKEKLN